MFKHLIVSFALLLPICSFAQGLNYTDAQRLTVVGKLMPTDNPYARLDAGKYPGITSGEAKQAANCTGMAVAFRTNSNYIGVDVTYKVIGGGSNCPLYATRGFDLYIKREGQWIWAGNGVPDKAVTDDSVQIKLIEGAGDGWKDCLVYLPLFSTIESLAVVTDEDSRIEAVDNPFKGRVAVFGSSYTHGAGCGRAAMTYPAQLGRMLGYEFINMGFSGNCKLQPYFAQALCEADVDAYLFDAFSNPTPAQMRERLFPFIEKIQASHPGKPLIFMKSVWREKRNFSLSYEAKEAAKASTADSLMRIAVQRYDNVYWVDSTNTIGQYHECTSDGSHPDSHGYTLWAESVRDAVDSVLKKYIKK